MGNQFHKLIKKTTHYRTIKIKLQLERSRLNWKIKKVRSNNESAQNATTTSRSEA